MVEPEASRFWQASMRCGLVEVETLNTWWNAIPPEKRVFDKVDVYLARQSVESGALTLWQAQQLMNGRWQGLRLGKYVLLQLLGQGGMGRVYLARDTRMDRLVALKTLSKSRSQNPRAVARFAREIRVGAKLQHENLIRVYDDGIEYGLRFLVMEYIDGKPVARLLQELGRLPVEAAADLARQVLLGLEHLHEQELLHRDVNPANILVNRSGVAKLTDLGLAVDLDDSEVLTRDGATVGTFEYISPEQARDGRAIDIRSDIYSLGCTLYQMLAGRTPFPGLSAQEKILAHQFAVAEPITGLVPGCPPGLAVVVHRMLQKSPDDRYARPIDAARALAPYSTGPVPLDQLRPPGAAPPDATTQLTEETTLAAVWFDSEAEVPPVTPIVSTPSSGDVFLNEEVGDPVEPEPGDLQPPGAAHPWPISPRWLAPLAVAAVLAAAAILAAWWL